MIEVDSTSIHSIGYAPLSQKLVVKFISNTIYEYFDVPYNIYKEFSRSESKGAFLNKEIKDKFEFDQVS